MLKTVVLFLFNGGPAKTYFCDAPRPSNCHRGEDLPSSSIPFFFVKFINFSLIPFISCIGPLRKGKKNK